MATSYAQWQRLCGGPGLMRTHGALQAQRQRLQPEQEWYCQEPGALAIEVLQRFQPLTCCLDPGCTRQHACLA
jgi:hypothetical protein